MRINIKSNIKLITVISLFILSNFTFSQGTIRFEKESLNFKLVNSHTGVSQECQHELLTHVPWWRITCDDRNYTVDTWIQIRSKGDLFEKTLMYHVSEGVQSSGEKLVQFKSHMTSFISQGKSDLIGLVSRIDVRNGQADLVLTIK